jgi:hypothetical protein
MTSRRSIIIREYLKMLKKLKELNINNIFPDFSSVVDIIFYFSYNFLMNAQHIPEKIEEILELNNYIIEDDEYFGRVCDIIINFINVLDSLYF